MLGEVDIGELELWSDEDSEGPTTPRADLGRGTGLESPDSGPSPSFDLETGPMVERRSAGVRRGRLSRACAGWRRRRR